MKALSRLALGLALIALITPADVYACATCFGAAGSSQVEGMNGAIVGLLIVTIGMMAAFGSFFMYLKRRGNIHTGINADRGATHPDRTVNQEERP